MCKFILIFVVAITENELYEKRTYHDIEKETGISAATISKVSKSMNYGPGGYELALARLREKEQK